MKINKGDFAVSSPAFEHGSRLPDKYTVAGEGISPPLEWSKAPQGTVSFAVLCHDADAPLSRGFTHWVLYNIPARVDGLGEGTSEHSSGFNSLGKEQFVPAGPPPGHGEHFYYFHVYAIGARAVLPPGLSSDQLLDAIDADIIEQARIVGSYSRV